jgi:hypothetical protein
MDQPGYSPPSLTGFWREGEAENETYRVSLNGRMYTVTELQSRLFPTAAGEATIGPAQITVPGFGFQRGGVLQSEPVDLTVQALPLGAPESFSGAVGQFDLQVELDTTATQLDEPVMATVTLSGWGNVGTAGDPVWAEATGWRTFNGDARVETVVREGRVGGIRTYEHTLIPVEAGEVALPPLEYSYFDPSAGEYRTLLREPGLVTVAPGPNGETASATAAVEEPTGTETRTESGAGLQQTVLEPMPLPAVLSPRSMPVTSQPWYWGLWALPVITLAGSVALQQRQAYRLRNADQIRRSKARREAQRALANLPATDDHTTIAQSNRILIEYLAVKVGHSVGGSTVDELVALLETYGVDPALRKAVQGHLAAGEAARYSPHPSAMGETFCTDTDALIGQLDAAL